LKSPERSSWVVRRSPGRCNTIKTALHELRGKSKPQMIAPPFRRSSKWSKACAPKMEAIFDRLNAVTI